MNYSEIAKTTEYKQDKNCCTVVASSIAFDVPFPEMQKIYFDHGRKRNRGYHMGKIIYELAEKFGYVVTGYELKKKYSHSVNPYRSKLIGCEYSNSKNCEILLKSKSQLTVNNFRKYLPAKNYILGTRDHVLAVKNGAVNDWTENRKHRINRIFVIEKIGEKLRPNKKAKYDFSSFV